MSNLCPECGKPVPAGSRHQLCPACLMAQAMVSQTLEGSPAVPEPEEIADKFPQFEILECLGRGGMGVVYKARQKSLNRLVAIKILAPERVHDARFAERFAREAELLAKLSHPHIVTIHDFGETGGLYYLVMEFVDGVSLRDLLREGKIEPARALAIVPEICDALQFAHDKGIIHRDIKPENILLDRRGFVKVADFGLAKLVGSENEAEKTEGAGAVLPEITEAGKVMGTPGYMAPEQREHPGHVDHRADIYALGVVFYQMLTGELPGKSNEPPSWKIQIDVRLDEIVLRALEKTPELRYQQVSEIKTMVETLGRVPSPSAVSDTPNGNLPSQPGGDAIPRGTESAVGQSPVGARTMAGEPFMHSGTPRWTVATYIAAALSLVALFLGLVLQTPNSKTAVIIGTSGFLTILIKLKLHGARPFRWTKSEKRTGSADGTGAVSVEAANTCDTIRARNDVNPWLTVLAMICVAVGIFSILLGFSQSFPYNVILLFPGGFLVGIGLVVLVRFWPFPVPQWLRNKAVPWIFGAVFLSGFCPVALYYIKGEAKNTTQLTQEGWKLMQEQSWSEAIAKFDKAAKLSPQDVRGWNGLGWARLHSGKKEEAEQAFLTAMVLEPENPAVLNGLGQLYLSERKYDAAGKYLLKAAPQAPAAWYGLARLYLLLGKFDEAEKWAQRLVDSGQGDAGAVKMLEAARTKHLSEGLRMILEPPPLKTIPSATPSDAMNAIQNWLLLMDAGDYSQSWETASENFRKAATKDEWAAMSEKVRKPLGALISRKAVSTNPLASLPGMPDGSYVVTVFDTSFAGLSAAVETVTFRLEKDSQWRAVSYLIAPAPEAVKKLSPEEKEAEAAAQTWLSGIDTGNYSKSWKDASTLFQAAINEDRWEAALANVRKPLGDVVSRKLKSAQYSKLLPGAPDGEYVVMQFDTSFAAKKAAVETVTFLLEKDGSWRAAGYFIR